MIERDAGHGVETILVLQFMPTDHLAYGSHGCLSVVILPDPVKAIEKEKESETNLLIGFN
jgi:hypothetical protein